MPKGLTETETVTAWKGLCEKIATQVDIIEKMNENKIHVENDQEKTLGKRHVYCNACTTIKGEKGTRLGTQLERRNKGKGAEIGKHGGKSCREKLPGNCFASSGSAGGQMWDKLWLRQAVAFMAAASKSCGTKPVKMFGTPHKKVYKIMWGQTSSTF